VIVINVAYQPFHPIGYAQGQLMKEQVLQVAKLIWAYMEIQVAQSLPGYLPTWLADLIADVGTPLRGMARKREFTFLLTSGRSVCGSGRDVRAVVRVERLLFLRGAARYRRW
jgi:hypothetical protein